MALPRQAPQGTWYQNAILRDEEFAQEAITEHQARIKAGLPGLDDEDAPESFVGLSREVETLIHIANTLQVLIATTVAVQGGSPGKPPQLPYPKSRFSELLAEADRQASDNLAAMCGLD